MSLSYVATQRHLVIEEIVTPLDQILKDNDGRTPRFDMALSPKSDGVSIDHQDAASCMN